MAYDGRAVANYVLEFAEREDRLVTNLSLQKIVYFCHVWSLIKLKRPLIKHRFEAWQYGPVLQYLYRDFCGYDNRKIEGFAMQLDKFTGERTKVPCEFDEETENLLVKVADFYSRLSSSQLVALSHVEGGPWDQVWNHGGNIKLGMKIEDQKIVEFYSSIPTPFTVQ
ncbi:type II toxin-antitoxin system antitoxin SocA domain-containing protein [Thalassospira sp.]|uniref:Panacea domain-containing protein n=1 Tax=Thalassospira sp. TaxID=1912094 RepID=UPI0025FE7D64|nr:type II toxin-antitoxin system antitoxin SocA domain-containing protein [Thalassospira sp.]